MRFTGWMMDIARDQSPREDWLHSTLSRSAAAGYGAVGLYLEHRYAYPSAPWAAGPGAVTPAVARGLVEKHRNLRVIPFLNTLGHMEGFIRAEGGQWLAETTNFWSLQTCPSRPECADFARGLVADALKVFDDEWVHIGGDEAWELGNCPKCSERVKEIGKAGVYGVYFGDLCRWVLSQGRRPCIWGDMLLNHPEAMQHIPRETILFDWQYFTRPLESSRKFRDAGFDVVCCPSVQTYNSGWCFWDATRRNIDEHAEDAAALGALGVLVTSWEFSYFTHYAGVMPLIFAAGRRLARGEAWAAAVEGESDASYAALALLVGERIPACAEMIKAGTWRLIRDRLIIRQNPFELWRAWRSEACGPAGDAILAACGEADAILAASAPASTARELALPIALYRLAVRWVRGVEAAREHYAAGRLAPAADGIAGLLHLFEDLRPELTRIADAGGSRADLSRLDRLKEKVEAAVRRIGKLPGGSYRPSFETLIHDNYIAGDQAAWRTGPLSA